jgi:hypothetical protein
MHCLITRAPRRGRLVAERRRHGRLVFDRALVIGQEIFGAEDAFEVEQATEKIGLAAFTQSA